jgi:hypothetical protein
MSKQNKTALEYLSQLADERFWGSVTMKFEAGRIVHVRREENLKPEELSGELRLNNDKSTDQD